MPPVRSLSLLLILLLGGSTPGETAPRPEGPAPHSVRMSLATLEVGDEAVRLRIRFFWDDLQIAVMERRSDMEFRLAENAHVDLIIQEYINDMLVMEVEGQKLQGQVVTRGVEQAARPDEVMWWYQVEYPTSVAPDRVYIKNRLLFNMFEDQRNIVHVKTKSGTERAYYFSWDEEDVTIPLG